MGEMAEFVRRWAEVYSDGSPDEYGSDDYLQLYAQDVDWVEAPTALIPEGRSGDLVALREATAFGRKMFRNRRVSIDEIVEDGHRAVWIGTWSASIGVDGSAYAVGATVHMPIVMLMEIRDGLIVRQRDFPTRIAVGK